MHVTRTSAMKGVHGFIVTHGESSYQKKQEQPDPESSLMLQTRESCRRRKRKRRVQQVPNIQHSFDMYEKTVVNKKKSTIDRSIDSRGEKGIYTQPSLPELPLFGKEQNKKYYNVDDTIYNVPRVGSLKKTDYHNRPWLIRKGNRSGLSMNSE